MLVYLLTFSSVIDGFFCLYVFTYVYILCLFTVKCPAFLTGLCLNKILLYSFVNVRVFIQNNGMLSNIALQLLTVEGHPLPKIQYDG